MDVICTNGWRDDGIILNSYGIVVTLCTTARYFYIDLTSEKFSCLLSPSWVHGPVHVHVHHSC